MDNRPIGVFDSGLGGLTVLKELTLALPNESMIYFGDTARVPYGARSNKTITKYAAQNTNFLISQNVKMIIVACGTVSSVALDFLRQNYKLPIIGVVPATARAAAAATVNKRVGVLGTIGTVKSGAFEKELKKADGEIEIISRPCPLFVPLAEHGHANSDAARLIAREYLAPLKKRDVDTIILGCTHYPLLKQVISDIMDNTTVLVDSGAPTAGYAARILQKLDIKSDKKAEYKFYVSDDAGSFSEFASIFLNKKITGGVSQIDIEQY